MFIDPFHCNWLDILANRSAELPDDVKVYLLLDGVFIPGMHRKLQSADNTKHVHLLFDALPGSTEQVKDVSPFLIEFDTTGSELVAKLRSRLAPCSGMPMVSAIGTTETIQELGRRLAAWCVVENDGQRFNFRFPDTRRLPGLYAALAPDQHAQLCGPMSFWAYISRDGTWADLAVVSQTSGIASVPQLDNEQFGRMVDDSIVDEILARLAYGGVEPKGLHSQAHATVTAAWNSTHAAGLDAILREEWCNHVFRNGEQHDTAAELALWQASINADEQEFG